MKFSGNTNGSWLETCRRIFYVYWTRDFILLFPSKAQVSNPWWMPKTAFMAIPKSLLTVLSIHQRLESCEGSDGLLPVLNPPWRDEQGSCEFSSNLSFDPVWNNMFLECSRFYFSFERPFVRRHAIDASMENLRFLLKKENSIDLHQGSEWHFYLIKALFILCVIFVRHTFVQSSSVC